MKLWIAIVVLMFATEGHAGKAEAVAVTSILGGSELLGKCESASVAVRNVCGGYLAGIVDTTATYDGWGDMDKEFCVPEGATLGQLVKVAIKGLNENPEELHLTASGTVANIFAEAFPCD